VVVLPFGNLICNIFIKNENVKMLYVKTDGSDNVIKYPYTIHNLRADNPNVSFPREISNDVVERYNMFPVTLAERPTYNKMTHSIDKNVDPDLENSVWVLNWTITLLSSDDAIRVLNRYKELVTVEANHRVNLIAGNSTDKLMAMMTAIDLLDIRNSRVWTDGERATMVHLRTVKAAVRDVRVVEATLKVSMESMTSDELSALDIKNHPLWP
jgi:hypothetical protein